MKTIRTATVALALAAAACSSSQAPEPAPPTRRGAGPKGYPIEVETECRAYLAELRAAEPGDPVLDPFEPALEGRLAPPKERSRVQPRYSPEARKARESGWVGLAGVVDRDGTVRLLRVVRSSRYESLDKASMEAVRAWTYEPARFEGQPVRAFLCTKTTFSLR